MKKTLSTLLLSLTALIVLSQDIKAPPKKKRHKKNNQPTKEKKNPMEESKIEEKLVEEFKMEKNNSQQEKDKSQLMENIITTDTSSNDKEDLLKNKASFMKEVTSQVVEDTKPKIILPLFVKNTTYYNKYREYFHIFRVFHFYNTADTLGKCKIKILTNPVPKGPISVIYQKSFVSRQEKKITFYCVQNKHLSEEENKKINNQEFLDFQNERFFLFKYLEDINQKYLIGFHRKGCTFDFLQPPPLFDNYFKKLIGKDFYFHFSSFVFRNAQQNPFPKEYDPKPSQKNINAKDNIAALINIFLKFLEIFINDGEACLLKFTQEKGDNFKDLEKKIENFNIIQTVYLAFHSQFLGLDFKIIGNTPFEQLTKETFCKLSEEKEKIFKKKNEEIINLLRKKVQESLTLKEYKYFQYFLIQNIKLSSFYLKETTAGQYKYTENNSTLKSYSLDMLYSNVILKLTERLPAALSGIFQIIALKAYPVFLYCENYLLCLYRPRTPFHYLENTIDLPLEKVKDDSNWEDIEDSKGNAIFDKYIYNSEDFENNQEFYHKNYTALPISKKINEKINNFTDGCTKTFNFYARNSVTYYLDRFLPLYPDNFHRSREEIYSKILNECSIYQDLFLWINLFSENLGHGKKLPLKGFLVSYKQVEFLSKRYMFIVNLVEQKNLNSYIMFKILSYTNRENFSLSLKNFNDKWTLEKFVKKNKFLSFLEEAYRTLLYLSLEDNFPSKLLRPSEEIRYLVLMISFDDFYCSNFKKETENSYFKKIARSRLQELTKKIMQKV